MSLELWLWFAAWVVLSEVVFVIWYYIDNCKWVGVKIISFILGAAFMALQYLIGTGNMFDVCELGVFGCLSVIDYNNFLYEFYIILAIGLFIGANYAIVKLIDKIKKRKKKRW